MCIKISYLAESERSISSLLQKHIDHDWKKTKLFLILCGSSMSFMENQVLGYKSPLYGRRTAQFKIQPFSFFEAREMCPSFSLTEQAVIYGLTWGVPEYLKHFDGKKSLDENIINLFFSESGRLFEEPSNLLKQEMRSPASYNAIIFAIAQGASQLNQIATKIGMESGACGNLLLSLMELGIVAKQVPVTEKPNSRKTVYSVNDSFFRFWYRFVFPNISYISRGMGRSVYENFVKKQLTHFMGKVFEDICLQYLYTEKASEQLPFMPEKIGRWWGTNKKEKQQEEIDIVCLGSDKIIFCEDKWTAKLVDDTLLNDLFRKSTLFAEPQKYFWLFSKLGFTKACKARAAEIGNVRLVAFKEMV